MLVGCILSGGGATRLGGLDKLGLQFGGKSICRSLCEAMAPVVDEIVVAAGPVARAVSAAVPAGVRVVRDVATGLGPLGGLHAAFAHTAASAVLLVGGDMPFVTTEVLALLRAAGEDADGAAFRLSHGVEPLLALYGRSLVPHIEAMMRAQNARMSDVLEKSMAKIRWLHETDLASVDEHFRSITNVNTPHDVAQIRSG